MAETLDKHHLMVSSDTGFDKLEAILSDLSEEQITEPQVAGVWTLREVLVNLAFWLGELVSWLEAEAGGEPIELPKFSMELIDEMNAQAVKDAEGRSVVDILTDFRTLHALAYQHLEMLSDDDLTHPERYPWMRGRAFGPLLHACMGEHYAEHLEHFEAAQKA